MSAFGGYPHAGGGPYPETNRIHAPRDLEVAPAPQILRHWVTWAAL